MKLLSWNVNGIRALNSTLNDLFGKLEADIICFQETKVVKEALDSDVALIEGYNSYFSFSAVRAGYSGVATFCKDSFAPFNAQCGLGLIDEKIFIDENSTKYRQQIQKIFDPERIRQLDNEGRCVITQHLIKNCVSCKSSNCILSVINVYCPMAQLENQERMSFKLDFYKLLEVRAKALVASGSHVLIAGDINVSHKPIDHCDPEDLVCFQAHPSRIWLDHFLFNDQIDSSLMDDDRFVDSFRKLHPGRKEAFTCWNTSIRARETNYGTRIDYIFVDYKIAPLLSEADIMQDFKGSDHCPIFAELALKVTPSLKMPAACTQHFARFTAGKQQNILQFAEKRTKENMNIELSGYFSKRPRVVKQQKKLTDFFANSNNGDADNNGASTKSVVKYKDISQNSKKPAALASNVDKWKSLFKPLDVPLCRGHSEPSVIRTVKKPGKNLGKKFFCCARATGHATNKEANCGFFQWVSK